MCLEGEDNTLRMNGCARKTEQCKYEAIPSSLEGGVMYGPYGHGVSTAWMKLKRAFRQHDREMHCQ
jgi:hypothetical protein